jgi:sugar phosphate isomerase/epimerase
MYGGRLETGLKTIAEAGFSRVELSVRFAEDIDASWLRSTLASLNLKVSAFASGQGCIHDDLCLNKTDPDLNAQAIQRMKDIIDLGAEFSAPVILGGVRGRLSGSSEETKAQRQAAIDAIRVLIAYAGDKSINLLLEPINRYETNFINTIADGLELIEVLGSPPNLLLLPDTFHMNIEEADIHTSLRQAGSRVGYIHFADSNRHAPGQGHTDFKTVMETLVQIGYQGTITAEILPLPDEAGAVQRTSNHLAALLGVQSLKDHLS